MDLPYSQQAAHTVIETVIGELLKGRQSATQLLTLLKKPARSSGDPRGRTTSVSAEELALQISRSFIQSISALTSSAGNEMCGRQIVEAEGVVAVSSVDRSSIRPLDGSRKRLGVKDRRGCYRRRNKAQSWTIFSPSVEDGHAWRKYGQKEILNTTFPRCYFRCTHKNDQACKANRQVQRIQEDPVMYQITYFGKHTCCSDALMRAPHFISETDPMEDACMLNFETKTTPTDQSLVYPNSAKLTANTSTTSTKSRDIIGRAQSDVSDNKSSVEYSSSSAIMLKDPMSGIDSDQTSGPRSSVDMINNYGTNSNYHHEEVVSSGVNQVQDNMEAFNTKFGDLDDDDLYFEDMTELLQVLP